MRRLSVRQWIAAVIALVLVGSAVVGVVIAAGSGSPQRAELTSNTEPQNSPSPGTGMDPDTLARIIEEYQRAKTALPVPHQMTPEEDRAFRMQRQLDDQQDQLDRMQQQMEQQQQDMERQQRQQRLCDLDRAYC